MATTGFAGVLYVLWPFIAQLLESILALVSSVWLGGGFHPVTYLPK